jgi:hypothetical protein
MLKSFSIFFKGLFQKIFFQFISPLNLVVYLGQSIFKLYIPQYRSSLTVSAKRRTRIATYPTAERPIRCSIEAPTSFRSFHSSLFLSKGRWDTRRPLILCRTTAIIGTLVKTDPLISEELVPYSRRILPVFNEKHEEKLNIKKLF